MTAYVAPAARVLTFLHRPDPDHLPDDIDPAEPINGWTVCGRPMLADELWMPVECRDGDQVCPACCDLAEDGYVQEVLL